MEIACLAGNPLNAAWQKIIANISALKIKWDSQQNTFVFQNGTHLPMAANEIYQRQIWKLSWIGFEEAKLVLERKNDSLGGCDCQSFRKAGSLA